MEGYYWSFSLIFLPNLVTWQFLATSQPLPCHTTTSNWGRLRLTRASSKSREANCGSCCITSTYMSYIRWLVCLWLTEERDPTQRAQSGFESVLSPDDFLFSTSEPSYRILKSMASFLLMTIAFRGRVMKFSSLLYFSPVQQLCVLLLCSHCCSLLHVLFGHGVGEVSYNRGPHLSRLPL